MKAVWQNTIIAQSSDTVVVEGNHYFPLASLVRAHIEASDAHTFCPWKGQASYFHVIVNGERNEDAAWWYPEPKPAAEHIKDRVAFWRGIQVIP